MSIPNDQFKDILKSVPRSYDDFVVGLTSEATEDDVREQIIQFITEHPEANSSDVTEFYLDHFTNEDEYDEDTVFYDDEWDD